jgi:3-methyl-2-oxobutanoate hydroxymethyltransferase
MDPVRVRVPDFQQKKARGEKVVMLTAYDATMARLFDHGGVDALLVGDSLGTVILGHDTTLPVTLDAVLHHSRAVSRGASRALIVADMPFMTYQVSVAEAVRNAGRLLQEGGAEAVKLEGGQPMVETVARLTEVGVPVMGHLGLLPQSVHRVGGFRRRVMNADDVDALAAEALLLEKAGAFAVVLEAVPFDAARIVTEQLAIPTIGIGAGPHCDGQILVSYDMLGLFDQFVPSFVKQYAHLAETILDATHHYVADVKEGRFPQPAAPARARE